MSRAIGLVVAAVVAFAVGCGASVSYVPTNAPPHVMLARSPQSVDVFTTGGPSQPYAEVGIMEAREGWFSSFPEMVQAMREAGAGQGCDGVIVTGSDQEITTSYDGTVDSTQLFHGACIVYLEEEGSEGEN